MATADGECNLQALLPRLADFEPLVRVRFLLAALYLQPEEADAVRTELQVLISRCQETLYPNIRSKLIRDASRSSMHV